MQIIRKSIIGGMILIGTLIWANPMHALYSPIISKRVGLIKQNVMEARQENGTGSMMSMIAKMKENDNAARAKNTATGMPEDARRVLGFIARGILKDAGDSIFMTFNILPSSGFKPISSCLRDDIWEMENLKDAVFEEMVKAYLITDQYHGEKLEKDYNYLDAEITRLKKYGMYGREEDVYEGISASEYFFGMDLSVTPYGIKAPPEKIEPEIDEKICLEACNAKCYDVSKCENACDDKGACKRVCDTLLRGQDECKERCDDVIDTCKDYCGYEYDACTDRCDRDCVDPIKIEWQGCPEGELLPAINQVFNSFEHLKTTLNPKEMIEWGSLLEMAEARGKRAGEEWIKKNQVTISIGGREGGTPQSLMRAGGTARLAGQTKTQLTALKAMIGPVSPLFSFEALRGGTLDNAIIAMGKGCVYYYPETGLFQACTPQQILEYSRCLDEEENPPQRGEDGEEPKTAEDDGIECTRFRNSSNVQQYAEKVIKYKNEIKKQEREVQNAVSIFKYHTQMNTVTENNIDEIRNQLKKINTVIIFGYEGFGKDGGTGLPTFYSQMASWAKKHCGGK